MPDREDAHAEPISLPLRQAPDRTLLGHLDFGMAWVSGVTHIWDDGDASRCGRCPAGQCTAVRGVCSFLVRGKLTPDQAEAAAPGLPAGLHAPRIVAAAGDRV